MADDTNIIDVKQTDLVECTQITTVACPNLETVVCFCHAYFALKSTL